jgi:branched-chain amino acid transport system permease protein
LVIAFPQGIVGFVQDKLGSHRKGDGGVASQPAKEAL